MRVSRMNQQNAAIKTQKKNTRIQGNLQASVERFTTGMLSSRIEDKTPGTIPSSSKTYSPEMESAFIAVQEKINLIHVADGALEEIGGRLHHLGELVKQSADTPRSDERTHASLQEELTKNIDEITRMAESTRFGSDYLLKGDLSGLGNLPATSNTEENQPPEDSHHGSLPFIRVDLQADQLGFGRGSGRTVADIRLETPEETNQALQIVEEALKQVNATRTSLKATSEQMQFTLAGLSVASENRTASNWRIQDQNAARESAELTQHQVKLQAGLSVLIQSNFQGQNFLDILE